MDLLTLNQVVRLLVFHCRDFRLHLLGWIGRSSLRPSQHFLERVVRWSRRNRTMAKHLSQNKPWQRPPLAACDKLAAAGVTFVAVHFDGYGDDGTTEEVKCYDGESYAWGESQTVKHDASHLQEHFEDLVPFGYENDCGGFGDVVLDVARSQGDSRAQRPIRRLHDVHVRGVDMAHPLKHAQNSARKFGGKPEDYLPIHSWFDESKAFLRTSVTEPFATMPKAFSWLRSCLVWPS